MAEIVVRTMCDCSAVISAALAAPEQTEKERKGRKHGMVGKVDNNVDTI